MDYSGTGNQTGNRCSSYDAVYTDLERPVTTDYLHQQHEQVHFCHCTDELYRVIHDYGEERFARNIARHIVTARQNKIIETTGELIDVIKAAIPMKARVTGGHPAKRTFQAIRIELNRELEVLEDSLAEMIDLLNDGGRICVITFHSLEDRVVKNIFRQQESPCICPKNFPVCVCGRKSKGIVITRKPILPSEGELEENKRSKSAKLRVFERRL